MRLKNNEGEISTGKYWSILIVFFLLLAAAFIFVGSVHWSFILLLIAALSVLLSMAFWQAYILPDLDINAHFSLSKFILLNHFIKSPLILTVRDGKIEGDYDLLKKKPITKIIAIDPKSAVLIEKNSKQKQALFSGTHILNNNPNILGVFFLGISSFRVGPTDKKALGSRNANESLAEYHSRINSAEKTRTDLSSGKAIYPSFVVLYRFAASGIYESDLELFNALSKFAKIENSPLNIYKSLETYLTNEIIISWKRYCKNKQRDDILTQFPGKFEPMELKIKGLICQIYVDQIY